MSLITIPTSEPPASQRAALDLLRQLNAQLDARVQAHKGMFSDFWHNNTASPADILAAMGANAHLLLSSAEENIRHIDAVARLAGKTVADFLEPEEIAGLHPMIANADGTVTLQ